MQQAIDHAAHLLPAQGPINVFVHHNTLHAFEHLPFEQAVLQAHKIFGGQPYLSEDRYRADRARGRIRDADLRTILSEDLGPSADEPVPVFGTRQALRLTMLRYPLRNPTAAELRWFVAETEALRCYRPDVPAETGRAFLVASRRWILDDVLPRVRGEFSLSGGERRVRDALADLFSQRADPVEEWSDSAWEAFSLQALWRVCREGVHTTKATHAHAQEPRRHRDLLLQAGASDSDLLVADVLIRFCAAFLDQGFSPWPLPNRESGLLESFCSLFGEPGGPPDLWLSGLAPEIARIRRERLSGLQIVLESLDKLGVGEAEQEDFLTATFMALRGWAGMLHQLEVRVDRSVHPISPGSLIEFLAVRLLLDRLAIAHLASTELGYRGPLSLLRKHLQPSKPKSTASLERRAFVVYQLAQAAGCTAGELFQLSKAEWGLLLAEIEAFGAIERRRIFHLAFERHYRNKTLDALVALARDPAERPATGRPRFQVVTCLDEREESFRRHLEEISPEVETFGAAGFFNVAMYYRGAADAHFVPLCPIIIRPQHWVAEDVVDEHESTHRRRTLTRRLLGAAGHGYHLHSRGFARGALLTGGFGILASVPLVTRILFPRLTARVRQLAAGFVQPPRHTCLELERTTPESGMEEGHRGYSLDEMVNIAQRFLNDIGLTRDFGSIVLILGHGSHSLNNPHNSAYNCGACGGGAGGPNARALAQILNDSRVRHRLNALELHVPPDTLFIGGFHNTCNDEVTFADRDTLPEYYQAEIEALVALVAEACERNAHERCRRFQSAPLSLSFSAAKRHVEARAEDLAQTRPECGHATNAVCYVGRRARTRGLFMDRRTFLTSYDPTVDDENRTILTRLLQAAIPVCAGINLEYYFSYVDPSGWGCGTKLPHNVTGLVGVMDGASSDLRPGLPWQMVEIHEPVRLLFVIETTPEAMLQILERNPPLGQLCRNDWVQLAVLDPHSDQMHVFVGGEFEPYQPERDQLPKVGSSFDWYRGQRDHLDYALIQR